MKKMILNVLMVISTSGIIAQININPDPYGDPWLVGGIPEITPALQSEIDSIPNFKLDPACLLITLPSSVDNSESPFMRDIFHQYGNSCAQASAVGYMFTYEIDYLRNVTADHDSSMYHPAFTYNFLNYGTADSGSRIDNGLRILKEMGCPSIQTYGKSIDQADPKEWITGYEKYESSLHSRISTYETIDMLEDSGLFYLKHWLADHNSVDTVGGLAAFGVKNMFGCNYEIIEEGPETGKSIIITCSYTDSSDAHALTIVGYNDSIRFDIDNSGTVEENEMGAFKVANSWGSGWPEESDAGYCYILYSLFSNDSVFLNEKVAYICYAIEKYEPEITIKAKMTHPNRRWFFNQLGMDTIAGSDTISKKNFLWPISNIRNGEFSLTGYSAPDDTLEIGIDYSYILDYEPEMNLGKVYFSPNTNGEYQEESMLWYGSMIDNRWNAFFELPFDNTPGNMELGVQWLYSVDYDLLPFSIENDTILTTDQIYRLSDTIQSGASLIIGDGHSYTELHLHDATVLIDEGANLYIRSWSSLIAKSGTNKIIVKGNIILDENVTVKSEGNATLTIEFENDTLHWQAKDDSLINIELSGYSLSSLVEDCYILGSNINLSSGTITFTENLFVNSTLAVTHPQFTSSSCEIALNSFDNNSATEGNAVITIEDYPYFVIESNDISYDSHRGIELYYAGESIGEHLIRKNIISFDGILGSGSELGIHSYLSYAIIENNYISNSDYGIAGFHDSKLEVLGDSLADAYDSTQQIYDNYYSHCIFSLSSFPDEFSWNAIGDSTDSMDKPYIKTVKYEEIIYDTTGIDWSGDPANDVSANCWSQGLDSDPEDRLLPVGAYYWDTTWCPNSNHDHELNAAEIAYYDAVSEVENENYTDAEQGFKGVIDNHPGSKYSKASLKSLFALNPLVHNSSYSSFKAYCDSLSANPGDSLLGVTAGWLSIHCNIKDGLYQQAVNSLDSIISNPPSLEDSIYALIDLSYVYTKMEDTTNQKSVLFSTHSDLIPKTYMKYVVQRDIWIEELLKSQQKEKNPSDLFTEDELKSIPAKISSVYPNPTTRSMDIDLEIFEEGTYYVMLYSLTGQKLLHSIQKYSIPGTYSIHQDVSMISPGIYFLVLQNNGAILDSKKLVKSSE